MRKREFLAAAGLSFAGAAMAQPRTPGTDELGRTAADTTRKREIPTRRAKTTPLFLTPRGWPNAIATDHDKGFWVQERRGVCGSGCDHPLIGWRSQSWLMLERRLV